MGATGCTAGNATKGETMSKEGKKPIGKIVLIVLAVLVVVCVVGAMGGKKTTTTPPADSSSQTSEQSAAASDTAATSDDKQEDSTDNLVVGTTVNLADGLSVTVDSVETGLSNYDGSAITGIHVTYVNNGDEGASYNLYDWKGEDANGAQQSTTYYSNGADELSSGTLAKGGTVSGNIYFKGDITRALYFGSILSKTASASWTLA